MRVIWSLSSRVVIVLALLLALASTSFAHRFATASDASFAEFVALGGNYADICGDINGAPSKRGPSCEACTLAQTAITVASFAQPVAVETAALDLWPFAANASLPRREIPYHALARGPPTV